MRSRSVLRWAPAVALAALLPLGLTAGPAHAQAAGSTTVAGRYAQESGPTTVAGRYAQAPDFTTVAGQAVAKTMPGHTVREKTARTFDSPLRRSQKVRLHTVTFTGKGRVFVVARGVGAIREVVRANAGSRVRVLAEPSLRRPGAGTRRALITSTADEWGDGLTTLTWSERRGVNYQIAVRGPIARPELLRLAQALPKDGTKVSKTVRSLVAGAGPRADSGVDAPAHGGVGAQGTGNKIVDGVDNANNDLSDEATLCNGCSHWNGNWAGMFQHMLYADGKMSYSAIDCKFGSQTAAATRSWQSSRNLAADGIAGPDTRGRMDNYLIDYWDGYVDYAGSAHFLVFLRLSDHYYYDGAKITYGYGGGYFDAC